jgi:hypothetical protein
VTDRLTDERREERAGDPENRCENEACRILGARQEHPRNDSRDEAYEHDPENAAHADVPY